MYWGDWLMLAGLGFYGVIGLVVYIMFFGDRNNDRSR